MNSFISFKTFDLVCNVKSMDIKLR